MWCLFVTYIARCIRPSFFLSMSECVGPTPGMYNREQDEQELKKYFQGLMKLVEGLQAIIITDRDGVPILKNFAANIDNAPELAARPKFLSTAALVMEQAGKLGMEGSKNVITLYGNHQVVSFNKLPLLFTLIATSTANTGMMLELESDFDRVIPEITAALPHLA